MIMRPLSATEGARRSEWAKVAPTQTRTSSLHHRKSTEIDVEDAAYEASPRRPLPPLSLTETGDLLVEIGALLDGRSRVDVVSMEGSCSASGIRS